jgi:hypothetical protein
VIPRKTTYRTPVRWAAPQSIALARGLGWLYGKAINGTDNGTVRIGYPAIASRQKYAGYVFPAQLFIGYSARRVATGAIRLTPSGLPSTSSTASTLASPLMQAMQNVTSGQMTGSA